jgi:hypothetical protein
MVSLGDNGNLIGAYYMLPFVSLNLAIRNPAISIDTRTDLLQAAFLAFFRMAKQRPMTGKGAGIYENWI